MIIGLLIGIKLTIVNCPITYSIILLAQVVAARSFQMESCRPKSHYINATHLYSKSAKNNYKFEVPNGKESLAKSQKNPKEIHKAKRKNTQQVRADDEDCTSSQYKMQLTITEIVSSVFVETNTTLPPHHYHKPTYICEALHVRSF